MHKITFEIKLLIAFLYLSEQSLKNYSIFFPRTIYILYKIIIVKLICKLNIIIKRKENDFWLKIEIIQYKKQFAILIESFSILKVSIHNRNEKINFTISFSNIFVTIL